MKNVAIIMAGGKGERFWPMSRNDMPKQFLRLVDTKYSMIQLTVKRINNIVDLDDIYIVTNEIYKDIIYKQLPNIRKDNIIFEPIGKNTAPCIGLASVIIKKKYGDANVIVLASDHLIKNENIYIDSLKLALKYTETNNIITLGIVPSHIETGYGYIKISEKFDKEDIIYKVEKFVEKPDYKTAKKYFESNNYLWNSGMFIWKNSTILNEIKTKIPNLYSNIERIFKYLNTAKYKDIILEEYNKMESISIDYGIMEHADNILVIPGNFGWDDVGNWISIERLKKANKDHNILDGNIISYNSKNNIIINNIKEKIVATVGIKDAVIVNTNDAILIMNKENSQELKKIIEILKEKKKDKYL